MQVVTLTDTCILVYSNISFRKNAPRLSFRNMTQRFRYFEGAMYSCSLYCDTQISKIQGGGAHSVQESKHLPFSQNTLTTTKSNLLCVML